MTPAGAILVGTTVGLAALDGGLSCLVGSAIVGGVAYITTRRTPARSIADTFEVQNTTWNRYVEEADTPEEKKKREKARDAAQKNATRILMADNVRVKHSASLVGLGSAICPGAGLATMAFQYQDKWMPQLVSALDTVTAPREAHVLEFIT